MNKISPLATVSPTAKLGDNVEVGPYAFIDNNVEIGDGCKIFPHATIFEFVKMKALFILVLEVKRCIFL